MGTSEKGLSYRKVHKQPFKIHLFRGQRGTWVRRGFGLGGDLGTSEKELSYLTVHKQPFKIYTSF